MVNMQRTCDGNRSTRVSDVSLELVQGLARDLDTKLGRRLVKAIRSNHRDIIELSLDPSTYQNADLFHRDWLAVNILRKSPSLKLGINTEAAALDAFRQAEVACLETNARLKAIQRDAVLPGISGEVMIHMIRQKIVSLIGDAPNLDDIGRSAAFSSGASTRVRRRHGDAYYKLRGRLHVTRKAALLGLCYVTSDPIWSRELRRQYGCNPYDWVEVVRGSKITTVPKNAKTDRTIAIEPELNMLLQKGVGAVFRRALRKVGINLNDQSVNQVLAYLGSLFGHLATLDLKAASDTIAYEVIRLLLPKQWFELLDSLRCEEGVLPDGKWVSFEKFSSMGNGFTFELESLIFWAINSAVNDLYVGERQIGVYGDDLITPTATAGWLVEVLAFFGFQTNDEKSFVFGPFRESCGKHFFNGVDVTPFSIDYPIVHKSDLFLYANSVRRWAARQTDETVCDPRYRRAYDDAVSRIPARFRHIIPDDDGDRSGLIGTLGEHRHAAKRSGAPVTKYKASVESLETVDINCGVAYTRALMLGGEGVADEREATIPLPLHIVAARKRIRTHAQSWGKSLEDVFLDKLVLRQFKRRTRTVTRSALWWKDSCYWPS